MGDILKSLFGRAYWLNFLSIMGAISMVALVINGFEIGVSQTFYYIIDYFNRFLGVAIGWLEPAIEYISRIIGIDVDLLPHWKHIYVITSVYFSANAINTWTSGDRFTGAFELVLGLFVGVFVFWAAGSVSINTPDLVPNMLVVLAAMIGAFFYETLDSAWRATFYRAKAARIYRENGYHTASGEPVYFPPPWWQFFFGGLKGSFTRSVVGLLFATPAIAALWLNDIAGWSVGVLIFLVLLQAGNFMRMGVGDARRIAVPGESFGAAYLRSGVGKVGIRMMRFFFWIIQLLLLNAGLGLVGL